MDPEQVGKERNLFVYFDQPGIKNLIDPKANTIGAAKGGTEHEWKIHCI
jgi:hypothetical protein